MKIVLKDTRYICIKPLDGRQATLTRAQVEHIHTVMGYLPVGEVFDSTRFGIKFKLVKEETGMSNVFRMERVGGK